MIKERYQAMNPHLNNKLLCSRDVLYITSNKTKDEQYTYPLANILDIEFKLALDVLDAQERRDYDVPPMEMLIVVTTVRHAKMFFIARNTTLTFDYFGFED